MPVEILPIVGVMGSGRDEHESLAEALGELLAALDVHLLTGGGRGVMTSVSRAFARSETRRGRVLGVLPADADDASRPADGYPNPWVEIALRTHLSARGAAGDTALSRNHVNILTSDALIFLPGGPGTLSEARLAIGYGRPACAYLEGRDQMAGLPDEIPRCLDLVQVRRFLSESLKLPAVDPSGD